MAQTVLITGGNQGDVRRLLEEAAQCIEERIGPIVKASRHYESEPWGFKADTSFWNQVLVVQTTLSPEELLEATQEVEQLLGRDRMTEQEMKAQSGARYASRKMDVDILFYDDRVVENERLQIPHPRIACREFVLRPLCEVLPDFRHPLHGVTIEELYKQWREASTREPNME